jgi:hypothetical protein
MFRKLICGGILLLLAVPGLFGATLITNEVDFSSGWTNLNNSGWFTASVGGLTPVEGSGLWTVTGYNSQNRGAWKLFDTVFTEETLQVSYSFGDRNDKLFPESITAALFADTDGNNIYSWTERIPTVAGASHPVPDAGWAVWEDTYEISASTVTANGDPVIGKKIGFVFVTSGLLDSTYGLSFDSLKIESAAVPKVVRLVVFSGNQ